jgi:hypothetical protein
MGPGDKSLGYFIFGPYGTGIETALDEGKFKLTHHFPFVQSITHYFPTIQKSRG